MITTISANGTQQKLNHENFADILNITFQNTYKLNDHHGVNTNGSLLR